MPSLGIGHLHGIAWVCHPKHLDADVRTSTIPWKLLEGQRLFAPLSQVVEQHSPSPLSPHLTRAWGFSLPHIASNHHTDAEAGSSMRIIHDSYDNNSLDFLMRGAYIIYQAVGRTDRTQEDGSTQAEGDHDAHQWTYHRMGNPYRYRPRQRYKSWYQQLRDWWTAHKPHVSRPTSRRSTAAGMPRAKPSHPTAQRPLPKWPRHTMPSPLRPCSMV